MASSNFPNRPFRLEDAVWRLETDVPGNRTKWRCQLWIRKNSYSPTFSDAESSFTFFINTIQVAGNTFTYNFTNSDALLLAQVDVWVPHNADGSRAFQMSGYANVAIMGYTEVHHTYTAPNIPRATKGAFSGGDAFDAGVAKTISLPRADSSFTHDVTWHFGTASGPITTGAGVSTSWTPALSMLTQIPNATEGVGNIKVITRNGAGNQIGSSQTTPFTLRAGPDVVPTISSLTLTDLNPDAASKIGGWVQGESLLRAVVNASGAHGSSIDAASFSVEGTPVDSGETVPLPVAGSRPVGASVVDSRGRTGTHSQSITVLAYAKPKVNSWSVQRWNASENKADRAGESLRVTLNASVSSLVVGTQKNTLSYRVRTRPRNGEWTTRNTVTHSALSFNSSFTITGGNIFSTSTAYEVEIQITDQLNAVVDNLTVGTIRTYVDATATQMAFGMMVDESGPAYQIAGPARVYDGSTVFDLIGASNAETQAGTLTTKPVTPASLASRTATTGRTGLAELATQAEVNAGTDAARIVTPATLAARTIPHEEFSVSSWALTNGTVSAIPATTRIAARSTVTGLAIPIVGGFTVQAGIYLVTVSAFINTPTAQMVRAFIDAKDNLASSFTSRIAGIQGGEDNLSGSIQMRMQSAGNILFDMFQASGTSRAVDLRLKITQLAKG